MTELQPVPTKRHIIVADLGEASRSFVEECLSPERFEITDFSQMATAPPSVQADLVIFRAVGGLDRMRALCRSFRSVAGEDTPLLACVAAETHDVIRPLWGNALQSIILTPLSAAKFRRKLDELDLGF